MDPFTVVIFGPVGVGKSSAVKGVCSLHPDLCYEIREPTGAMINSGALQDVYDNTPGSGFRLQMLVLAERLSTYWQCAARIARASGSSDRPIIVADGHMCLDQHIYTNEHLANKRMSPDQEREYRHATSVLSVQCPTFMLSPDVYIYLKGSPDTCFRRASARARDEEASLQRDFFERMCCACDEIEHGLRAQERVKVLTLDTDAKKTRDVCELVSAEIQNMYKYKCLHK